MDQQLIDWVAFCEGREDFDKSHFYTLFFEGEAENGYRSEDELRTIFQFFPHSDELLKRMKSILPNGKSVETIPDIKSYLIENTRQDLLQKKIVLELEKEDELIELVQKPIKYVSDIAEVSDSHLSSSPDADLYSIIGDFFINITPTDKKTNALEEAFYGFTTNYNLVRYLLRPLIDTDINLDYYYHLWKVGGDYSVTEDGIIVSKHKPEKS